MLKRRIIPCLDVKNGQVVKGVRFKNLNLIGDPVSLAKYYEAYGADELVLYDIGASEEGRSIRRPLVTAIKAVFALPLTVGGGVGSLEDVDALFAYGADKVSINSGAIKDPELIHQAAEKYGSQSIVGSLDTAYNPTTHQYEIVTGGGKKTTGIPLMDWIDVLIGKGAGELVINVIDTDGMQSGYALPLLSQISNRVNLPIIASGGAGKPEDFIDLFTKTGCTGALAASIFHSGQLTIPHLKKILKENGLPIRKTAVY